MEGEDKALEWMVRSGEHQFTYQAELRHQLPRLLLVFTELWSACPRAAHVQPLRDISTLIGLPIEEVVLIGMSLLGGNKNGLVEPYENLNDVREGPLRHVFTPAKVQSFLRWSAGDYKTLRANLRPAPHPAFERFSFNALRLLPLVRPDVRMPNLSREGLVLPVWRFLLEKMTFGIFHMLADHHNLGGGNNPFRNAFGDVFQAYVGRILKESFGSKVLAEWPYEGTKGACDTPDWMIPDGDRLTVFEVKATGLGLRTRMFGDLDDLRADLKKLSRAVRQFRRFIDDVNARRHGLEPLATPREVECVIVTFDRMYFANSVVRDELMRVAAAEGVAPLPHVHLIPVEDLEYFVGVGAPGPLFETLREKRLDGDANQMDFHDWLSHRFGALSNPFLKRWHDGFLGRYGLPPIATTEE